MPVRKLKKLLGKEAGPILGRILAALDEPVAVLDADGELLFGKRRTSGQAAGVLLEIIQQGSAVGRVVGPTGSTWPTEILALIEYLLSRETERKDLAAEVLENYRELHLLYRLSEKLVASLEPAVIAGTMLNEVAPLVQVEGGIVLLKREEVDTLTVLASYGVPLRLKTGLPGPDHLVERVIQTGMAELLNEIPADPYFHDWEGRVISLVCAPLKTEKRTIGAVILAGGTTRQFSANDLKLLNTVAMQAAPALEIAHLHQLELQRARLERDLHTARQVQSSLLPSKMPELDGWRVSAYWQPAREVGGDFYEFIHLRNGRLALAVADVTDKGVPSALMMANTRSVLRAVAGISRHSKGLSPGKLLAQVNNLLCDDMPTNMFVTCLLVILDPATGRATFANAGHNLAFLRTATSVIELRARGVPLGLFPDMEYEDKEVIFSAGESLLMYSDGLIEAHNLMGEMFGTGRLRQLLAYTNGKGPLQGERLIQHLLTELSSFTGPNWEQEDDVTLVTLERCIKIPNGHG
jgi:serine phosphatase RsbU (regulator of sigma subunit)